MQMVARSKFNPARTSSPITSMEFFHFERGAIFMLQAQQLRVVGAALQKFLPGAALVTNRIVDTANFIERNHGVIEPRFELLKHECRRRIEIAIDVNEAERLAVLFEPRRQRVLE